MQDEIEYHPDELGAAIIAGLMQLMEKIDSNELIPVTRMRGVVENNKLIITNEENLILPARQLFIPPNHGDN